MASAWRRVVEEGRYGDLVVLGKPFKQGADLVVQLRCVRRRGGKECGTEFARRLARIVGSKGMCERCAAKERAESRCKGCGATGHTRDRCPELPPPRRKCELCFGTPHMVKGARCRRCGLRHAPEPPVGSRVAVAPPPVAASFAVDAIAVVKIKLGGETQTRARLDESVVEEYRTAIVMGAELPRPTLFFDGRSYWVGDGFHRIHAWATEGRAKIECEVHVGGRREALLHSAGANVAHGLRRTNADKRRAVEMLLEDDEWRRNSDRWIATRCVVSHEMVRKVRRALRGRAPTVDSLGARSGQDGVVRRLPAPRFAAVAAVAAVERVAAAVERELRGWPAAESTEPLRARLLELAAALEHRSVPASGLA